MSRTLVILLSSSLAMLMGCGPAEPVETSLTSDLRLPDEPVSMDKDDYPVFPDADAGADPSVSGELGGAGFTGEGWETNLDFDLIGDPHATKGGVMTHWIQDFPATLRIAGPEWNTYFNYSNAPLIYEFLLNIHPTTLEYIPSLATHWQISDDRMTYRFRLNPSARFSDGAPVTARDVIASWEFLTRQDIQDPTWNIMLQRFEPPVAESPYIVSVRSKTLNWRNLLDFATQMMILPAASLEGMSGDAYIRDHNYSPVPGSGPYEIRETDVVRGNSVTLRRREDYWAENYRKNVGIGNFGELRYLVVRDQPIAWEMMKKGEIDWFNVNRASIWANDTDFEGIRQGWIQKRRAFNAAPVSIQGIALNMRRAPFDDIRLRQAFTHLFNREEMLENLMFNQYIPQTSYFAGGIYENPDNPPNPYDPERALELLGEAGWSQRDRQGRLVRNGEPLSVELLYSSQSSEPIFTIFQEDLRRVGITLNLRLVTFETQFRLVNERRFDMASMAWGLPAFPDPEAEYHSSQANVDNTSNIAGISDSRIDALIEEYKVEFDQDRRVEIIRRIDGLIANLHPYILEWYAPYIRIVYTNRFGTPPGYVSRIADEWGGFTTGPGIPAMWWIDPAREREFVEALADPTLQLGVGEVDDRYWIEYAETLETSGPR